MTTIDTHAGAARESAGSVVAFFSGVAAWVTTTDHKKIGRIYLVAGLLGLLATSILSMLLAVERSGEAAVLDGGALLQLFQAERVGWVFAGLLPISLGLAIAVVPLQLGARQIAFPRVAMTGCYVWLGGIALTFAALARNGGIGGGDVNAVDMFVVGVGVSILGLTASAGCLVTSILSTRAPGMTMRRVALFTWSSLIGTLGMVMALPVAFGALIYLYVDHRLGLGTNFGGAAGVGDWAGWVVTVPAVVVFALPVLGVASELIAVAFRHRPVMRGVQMAGFGLVGVTALSAVTQQRAHLVSFDRGQSFGDLVRDYLPFLVLACLPLLGLVIVLGLGGLTAKSGAARGAPRISAALVFSVVGAGLVTLGVVAGAVAGISNLEVNGTAFEAGSTAIVVYGALLAAAGGMLFWAPKLWGRVVPDKLAMPLVLPGLGGAVLAAVPMWIAGLRDHAGGVPATPDDVQALLSIGGDDRAWFVLALIGHALIALTIVALGGLMARTFLAAGEAAGENPVGGHTIEWSTTSPAPEHNYEYTPTVASATPQFDMTYEGSLS